VDGVEGPIFVSIGTAEKLRTFLDLNPRVSKDQILVDDYNHKLYKELGFSRFDQVDLKDIRKLDAKKLFRFFQLGFGNMWNYATKALEMAPVEGGVNWLDLPEGGLRNGGTLVVKGNDVIFQWSDTIPSDVPNVLDVLEIAKNSVRTTKG